jgi:protein-disulfide isomerase
VNAPHDDKRTTREKAAQARAAAEAADRSRQRRLMVFGIVGVLVLVTLIIGGALLANRNATTTSASVTLPSVNPSAALPKTVLPSTDAQKYGVPLGSKPAAPLLETWEDFQCPICGEFERQSGAAVAKLAADGVVRLVVRPATFIDLSYPASDSSSARAVSAWGCAIDAGVGQDYRSIVFANQPVKEGTGYTDTQLVDFGTQAGLTGAAAATFSSCVSAHTYLGWAVNSQQAFRDSGVPGTPYLALNGTELPNDVVLGPTDALVAYIKAHAAA